MKIKNYIIENKKYMKEWLYEKNVNFDPNLLTYGSNQKVWWKCEKGHIWEDTISHRTRGRNCPYCSNHRLLKGFNDFATIAPHLIQEWNYDKNIIMPYEIFPHSNKKVWWKCEKGHEWEDTPNHRVSRDNTCPYCSNIKLLKGYNDLVTINPELSEEWNYQLNGNLNPNEVIFCSSRKVWWKCEAGHTWEATIRTRNLGAGCPICKRELQTSYPEQTLYFYIKKIFPNTINRYKEKKFELDVYIPDLKLGIEYDGARYHNEKTYFKEIEKDEYYSKKNIRVIRIKEDLKKETIDSQNNVIYYSPISNYKNLDELVNYLFNYINSQFKININIPYINHTKDSTKIYSLYLSNIKENSIMNDYKLSSEWNYQKNGSLNPWYITINSGKKVWWQCDKGHEWQAVVSSRHKHSCPVCSNQLVLKGFNDLQSKYPKLIEEWNKTKNINITPDMFVSGTNKKVWWMCSKGHEWQAAVSSRIKGIGCPYCTRQKAIVGENDLKTLKPMLVSEWDYEQNGNLLPEFVTIGSGRKVWWKCSKGHTWQAIIKNRVAGMGCPICYSKEKGKSLEKIINVYSKENLEFVFQFSNAKKLCEYFNLDYYKYKSSISLVCNRKQKYFLSEYVLRYDFDDEIK